MVVVQTNVSSMTLLCRNGCAIYIISVHVGRNFHVLCSCVVIIIMMFRGCFLIIIVVFIHVMMVITLVEDVYTYCDCIYTFHDYIYTC